MNKRGRRPKNRHMEHDIKWYPTNRLKNGSIIYRGKVRCTICKNRTEIAKKHYLNNILKKNKKYICVTCKNKLQAEDPNWIKSQQIIMAKKKWGSGIVLHDGYTLIRIKYDHPYFAMARDIFTPKHGEKWGYIFEHRLRKAEELGRILETWEEVHHLDGNKQNNKPENLYIVDRYEHSFITKLVTENKKLKELLYFILYNYAVNKIKNGY